VRLRRTLRTELTLLYALPFLASGAILLSIQFLSLNHSVPAGPVPVPPDGVVETDAGRVIGAAAVALVVLIVVGVGLGWVVAGRFLRPLRSMTALARDISASNLHRRLGPTGRRDELSELAATLDDLFGRLQASFDAQRHFVANAAHELRTPLTAERTLLQVALADPAADLRAVCRDVLALGETQERLIDSLLTLATGESGLDAREEVDLADVAAGVVASRAAEAARRKVSVQTHLAPTPVLGDPGLVESAVANLVDNAVRHNVPGGRVEVVTASSRLTVRNTGPVVPPEEVATLFEPFRRLGPQRLRHGEGHGLGLAIVRAIATAHGAVVTSSAPPTGGLTVELTFPQPPG
jgi:signal transduction histidine kinase